MSKRFDAVTKTLVEAHPSDWVEFVGMPRAPAEVINAELSTVTTEADKVLRVFEPAPYLLHLEFQARRDRTLIDRTLRYNVLLTSRHELSCLSVVIVLRPQADGTELTGNLQRALPLGNTYLEFKYNVVRIWEKPVHEFLAGPMGILPFAPLSQISPSELRDVILQMEERLERHLRQDEANDLLTAAYVLMGLRYTSAVSDELLRGVKNMRESTTNQAILREGKAEGKAEGKVEGKSQGAREILLRLGVKRLGDPDPATRDEIDQIQSFERLEDLIERIDQVESWHDLMSS